MTSPERPGWNYSKSGTWYFYLPIQENGYTIKIEPLDRKPVVYLRLTTNRIKKKGRFTEIIKTVNHQNKIKIETKRKGEQKKETITTLWYPLNGSNLQQFEIKGPSKVRIFSRILFDNNQQMDDYYILIKEDGIDLGTYYFKTEKSIESSMVLSRDYVGKWRSLWLNIPEGKSLLILVDDVGRNFLIDDLLENSAHGFPLGFRWRAPEALQPALDLLQFKCENACA